MTAFEAIKAAIAEEVTLAHPRADRPLLVVCDASDYGMGAMLAQLDDNGNERPIAYTSATFYGPALRYTTTEKEGLAVVWAAAHFRPYIHGVPTVVVTDHSALTWILSRGDPPARIAHWVMDLSQYDFTYVHRKGAHNNVADALSRLLTQMDAVDAVDGSGDMPVPCTLRTMSTRQRKKQGARSPARTDQPSMPPTPVQIQPQGAEFQSEGWNHQSNHRSNRRYRGRRHKMWRPTCTRRLQSKPSKPSVVTVRCSWWMTLHHHQQNQQSQRTIQDGRSHRSGWRDPTTKIGAWRN